MRLKYRSAIKSFSGALASTVWDVEPSTYSKMRRIKRQQSFNYNLMYYRAATAFFHLKEYMRSALVLQLVSKSPYRTMFAVLAQIDAKRESARGKELFPLVYKMPVLEYLICMYKERGMAREETELMRVLENAEIFRGHPKHKKKLLKQNMQIDLISEMNDFCTRSWLAH